MEQVEFNLLYRWFVGLNVDEPVWAPTVFSKNRDRLLRGDIAEKFFAQVLRQARAQGLLSNEHFSVDGTLIEAWASQKSFHKKEQSPLPPEDPGNPTVDFHGEKRSNDTHASTTDPDVRLARKSGGHEAKLAYCANVLIENRHGLVVDTELVRCSGTAEREAAMRMAERIPGGQRVTVGADKAYDTQGMVRDLRERNVTPHVAQNTNRPGGSAVDRRTTRHSSYPVSQRKRKRIEEVFGWLKTVGMLRKTRHRGVFKVGWVFTFAAGLQSGADEEPARDGSFRVSSGRSVPERRKHGHSGTSPLRKFSVADLRPRFILYVDYLFQQPAKECKRMALYSARSF